MAVAKARLLNYLYATLTQGAADGFIEAAISTPVSSVADSALAIREILVEWSSQQVAANLAYEVAVTRKSMAAMPTIAEKALIAKVKRMGALATNGAVSFDQGVQQILYTEENSPIVVESTLYAQLDSNASTVVNTARVRIGYEVVSIKEVDRLSIIAASLQP